jgi:hypothetical protein
MIEETVQAERRPENGSDGRPLAVTEGIVWSLGRLQRIENEAVTFFETSVKRGVDVGRDLLRALISGSAEVSRETVKAAEEIGTSLTESAAALAKSALGASGEVGGEAVTVIARSVKLVAAEAGETTGEVVGAADVSPLDRERARSREERDRLHPRPSRPYLDRGRHPVSSSARRRGGPPLGPRPRNGEVSGLVKTRRFG